MLACMLAMCVGAPPESSRLDPPSIYVTFLLANLGDIRAFDDDIQRFKARLRRTPSAAERYEKLILKCYEMRDVALCACYRNARGLLREYRLQVWLAFRLFLAKWSAAPR